MQNFNENANNVIENRIRSKLSGRPSTTQIPKQKISACVQPEAKEKKLINTGLHRLASSLNNSNRLAMAQMNRSSRLLSPDSTKPGTAAPQTSIQEMPEPKAEASRAGLVDKATMTDLIRNEKKLEQEKTILNEKTEEGGVLAKDLPWSDIRLVKKYDLKKAHLRKAMTAPLYDHGDEQTEEKSHEVDAEIVYSGVGQYLFKMLYYFGTASGSFMASMCGITLITFILSKFIDESFWLTPAEPPKNEFFIKTYFNYCAEGVWTILRGLLTGIVELLTLPRRQVFEKTDDSNGFQIFNF